MSGWKPIATAPKDTDILVWYDHDADPYQCQDDPNRLTDYAAWAEGGPFMDGKGRCIAKWQDALWEPVDEYGAGYHMPAYWFAMQNDEGCIPLKQVCKKFFITPDSPLFTCRPPHLGLYEGHDPSPSHF